MQRAPDAPYIFISYASADRERVLPLVDALARAGVAVWIDREGIHGGANYGREIAEAIKDAAAFILMASALSLASRNVKQEIAVAWEYERAYLPLLLESVTIPDDLKYWLTAAQWIEVLDKPEGEWPPPVLAALAPLGITRKAEEQAGMPLAGRERELALLREKIAAAKEGKSGLVLMGAQLALDDGDLPTAEEWLRAHRGFVAWSGAVLGQSEEEALWAEYHRQSGDREGAYEHADRALAHATAPRQPLALLAAHRLLGALDADAGRYEDAAIHLEQALALATACEAPYERALTLLALAELGAVTGETEEAVRLLTEGRAICEPLGAKPARERADALATRLTIT